MVMGMVLDSDPDTFLRTDPGSGFASKLIGSRELLINDT